MFGTIYLTSSKEQAEAALLCRSAKVVVLDENNPFGNLNDVIMGTILLPPYEAMSAIVDGEDKIAIDIYMDYLNGSTQDMFICVLIAALYKGVNILLYVPEDESFFVYGLLVRFTIYGIQVGKDDVPFGLMEGAFFDCLRLSSMYVHDIMTSDDFLKSYPNGCLLLDFTIPKLIEYYNPHLNEYTAESYAKYFNEFKERVKGYKGELQVPFVRGE